MSLFFKDLSKLKPIQVRMIFLISVFHEKVSNTITETPFYAMHQLLCHKRHSRQQFMELHLHLCPSTIK